MPRKLNNALTAIAVKNAKPGRYADGNGVPVPCREGQAAMQDARRDESGRT